MRALIPYAGKDSFERGWATAPEGSGRKSGSSKRNLAILRRHQAGHTHADIAADYGISRERVGQIVEALGGKSRRSRGKS